MPIGRLATSSCCGMTGDCWAPDSSLGLAWGISVHKMRLSVFLSEGPESLPVLLRVLVLLLLLLLFMVVLLFLAMLLLLFLAMLLFLLLVWVLFLEQVPVI
jgi:hypothetical protein